MSTQNIPQNILDKIGKNLYLIPNHPISIIKNRIYEYFVNFDHVEIQDPYISTEYNFDKLLVPLNHPSRSSSDTFYQDVNTCLRTHMTAYLHPLNKEGKHQYICCGDVYRKDAIDATHYPIFHQIDGFKLVEGDVKKDLRETLIGLIKHLFGTDVNYHVLEDTNHEDIYFPFTVDSFEIEVEIPALNKFVEVLGAGTVHPEIMKDLGLSGQAWAFGLGLERLAMLLFEVPDIRLFWSEDQRFLSQFKDGNITKFIPFSKYESCYKDVSFWLSEEFSYTEFCSLAREIAGDMIESITLHDRFAKGDKESHCYRIMYRSMDRTLTNTEIDNFQFKIREDLASKLKVVLR